MIQEREFSHSSDIERKSLLTSIPTTNIVNLDVNEFYLVMKVPLKCFFTIKLLKNIFELEKIIYFGLILGFYVFFRFLRPLIGLSRYLWCFPDILNKKELKFGFLGQKTRRSNF